MILFKGTSCFCLGYKCEFVEISTQNHVTFQINIFSSNILSKVEWMNEWINESNNERMNECINECMNEWMKETSSFPTNIQAMFSYIHIITNILYLSVKGVEKKYYRFISEDIKKRSLKQYWPLYPFPSCSKCAKASKNGKISIQYRQKLIEFPKPTCRCWKRYLNSQNHPVLF